MSAYTQSPPCRLTERKGEEKKEEGDCFISSHADKRWILLLSLQAQGIAMTSWLTHSLLDRHQQW